MPFLKALTAEVAEDRSSLAVQSSEQPRVQEKAFTASSLW